MKKNYNITYNIIKRHKGKEEEKNYFKYLNNNSIKLINKFYKKDFELFNYKML